MLHRKHMRPYRAAVARAVVFLYTLFLLMPHFGPVTHTHRNGGATHDHVHATASRHDVALERAALALIPDIVHEGAPHLETNPTLQHARRGVQISENSTGSANSDRPNASSLSDHTTLGDRDARAHTHTSFDPNLIALGAPTLAADEPAAHALAPDAVPGFVPALAILASPARAPPVSVI